MTTTRYVNTASTAGGDGTTNATTGANRAYATLSEAESNLPATLTDDWVIECSGSTDDTTVVIIDGVTTSSTNDLTFQGDQTTGIWDNSKYTIIGTSSRTVDNREDYVNIVKLQVSANGAGAICIGNIGTNGSNTHLVIDKCILRAQNSGSNGFHSQTYSTNSEITNTLIYKDYGVGQSGGDEGILSGSANSVVDVFNCTVYNFDDGIERDGGTITLTNCLVFGNGTDFDGTITATYCASDDSKAGTGNFQITQTASDYAALINDLANNDFTVTDDSSELYNAGTNTGAPSDDIIGTSRPQATTTDIGCFEFVVVGPTARPLPQRVLSGCFSGPLGGPL